MVVLRAVLRVAPRASEKAARWVVDSAVLKVDQMAHQKVVQKAHRMVDQKVLLMEYWKVVQ